MALLLHNKQTPASSRRKLWDIPEHFHCSIIGTCLTLDETRKIITRAGFQVNRSTPDYFIHGTAVNSAHLKTHVSGMIQKTLEAKFSREIENFLGITTEQGLQDAWKNAVDRGHIAGEYWAIMTHPSATLQILNHAFGEVHMLSHLNGCSKRGNIREIQHLQETIDQLESGKKKYRKRIKELEAENLSLLHCRIRTDSLEEENANYRQQIASLQNGGTIARLFDEIKILVNLHETEKYNRAKSEEELKRLKGHIKNLEKENNQLKQKFSILRQAPQEDDSTGIVSPPLPDTGDCGDCPNRDHACRALKGKHILYVGGNPSAVPRLRTLVENKGGIFSHHDGGIENNFSMLADTIMKADTIFCPLDCISHNACKIIKKVCRRHQKECVLLRSSGLSSFSHSLERFDPGLAECCTITQ